MRSGVPPDAGKAQESLLEAVVVILERRSGKPVSSTAVRRRLESRGER